MVYAANNVEVDRAPARLDHHPTGGGGDRPVRDPPPGCAMRYAGPVPRRRGHRPSSARRFVSEAVSRCSRRRLRARRPHRLRAGHQLGPARGVGLRDPDRAAPGPHPHRGGGRRRRRTGRCGRPVPPTRRVGDCRSSTALADDWGVIPRAGAPGKTVWAMIILRQTQEIESRRTDTGRHEGRRRGSGSGPSESALTLGPLSTGRSDERPGARLCAGRRRLRRRARQPVTTGRGGQGPL